MVNENVQKIIVISFVCFWFYGMLEIEKGQYYTFINLPFLEHYLLLSKEPLASY